MAKSYSVGLVGESKYQPAIKRCRAGESVIVCHEPNNPYDALALRVDRTNGETIGYIGRDSWLREAIHNEGKGVDASISSIHSGERRKLGVVITVELNNAALKQTPFEDARTAKVLHRSRREARGIMSSLIRSLFR